MGGSPYRAVLRGAGRVWRDLRFKDLYRSGKEFELMHRAIGFAALAILTVIPLLIVIAAANPAPHPGLAAWVVYGMGLTGSSAGAVTRLFSAPARVLGTTSVFSALLLGVSGVAFAGSVQAGFERIWGLPAGPWHKIWRQAVWLAALTAYIYAEATVGTVTHGGLAETAAAAVLGIAFFWWGLRFLIVVGTALPDRRPGGLSGGDAGRGGDDSGPGWPAGLLQPGLRAARRQQRGQLRRAGHRLDRAVVADRRRLGHLWRPVVRALVPRRLAADLGAQPLGPRGAGRRGRGRAGRAGSRESKHTARVEPRLTATVTASQQPTAGIGQRRQFDTLVRAVATWGYARPEKTVGQWFGVAFLAGTPASDPGPRELRPLLSPPHAQARRPSRTRLGTPRPVSREGARCRARKVGDSGPGRSRLLKGYEFVRQGPSL